MSLLPPLAEIVIYDGFAEIRTFKDGAQRVRNVSLEHLATVFADVRVSTGILPAHTLFWQLAPDGLDQYVLYLPPHVRHLLTATRRVDLPLPPLVVIACGRRVEMYAVKQRPTTLSEPLFWPPLSNIMSNASICVGGGVPDIAGPETVQPVIDRFFGNIFTPHAIAQRSQSEPHNIFALWERLDGAPEFPLDELVPAGRSLESVLNA